MTEQEQEIARMKKAAAWIGATAQRLVNEAIAAKDEDDKNAMDLTGQLLRDGTRKLHRLCGDYVGWFRINEDYLD